MDRRKGSRNDDLDFSSFAWRLFWKPDRNHHLFCGSFFELPVHYVIANLTDVDRMMMSSDRIAIPHDADAPRKFRGIVLRVDGRYTPPGFARLMKTEQVSPPKQPKFYVIDREQFNGPARTFDLSAWLGKRTADLAVQKGFAQRQNVRNFLGISIDEVEAVICRFWPMQADEWRERRTLSGWPDENLKERVIRGGCHLVSKPHFSNPQDETVWRFSFSQAELILIHSWNDVQKYVYHLLRIIKRQVSKNCAKEELGAFGNYLFKTLMFWACEEKPEEFWKEDQIETSVGELLCSVVECLIERKCPQYFIPDNNILGCSDDVDYVDIIDLLLAYDCGKIRQLRVKFPNICGDLNFKIRDRMILGCKLHAEKFFVVNPLAETIQPYYVKDFSQDIRLRLELGDLYEGVRKHLALKSSANQQKRKLLIEEVEKHYRRSVGNDFVDERFAEIASLHDSAHVIVKQCVDSKRYLALQSFNEDLSTDSRSEISEYQLGGRRQQSKTTNSQSTSGNSATNTERSLVLEAFEQIVSFVLSDLLKNPSYIISSAFLANFYYSQLNDYRKAIEICEEVVSFAKNGIDGLKINFSFFLDSVFQIFLDPTTMSLFDRSIQTVFGFVVLFVGTGWARERNRATVVAFPNYSSDPPEPPSNNTRSPDDQDADFLDETWSCVVRTLSRRGESDDNNNSKRFIVVNVSPVEFLKYVGARCRKLLRLERDPTFDILLPSEQNRDRLLKHSFLLRSASNLLD